MPGTATTNGHYTAMIKKGDHWWDMNDYSVTRTDPSKTLKAKKIICCFMLPNDLIEYRIDPCTFL